MIDVSKIRKRWAKLDQLASAGFAPGYQDMRDMCDGTSSGDVRTLLLALDEAKLQRDYARARCRLLQSSLRWDGGRGVDVHAKAKRRMRSLLARMSKAGVKP